MRCGFGWKRGVWAGLVLLWAAPATAQLEDLQPGEWYEAPNTQLEPHMPPATGDDYSGTAAVMSAWSGAAYDTQRDRLIVWGGGHHDYAGNEIYVFDVGTLSWSRLTERSADVGGNEASGYYPDGTPRSRHTYEYIEYVPNLDALCSFGGAALFPSGQVGIDNVDCFDFAAGQWARMADAPSAGIGSVAAVHPTTGHVWMQAGGPSSPLAEYDPFTNRWSEHVVEPSGWFDYHYTADIDPGRNRLVAVGGGQVVVWDLARPSQEPVRLQTTGATSIQQANNPGVAYDRVSDRIVAYDGGADVYALDLESGQWALHAPAESNSVTPPAAADNGTFGRFRYIPSLNLFVVVHAVDQNVYFYRLAPGDGVVPEVPVDPGGQNEPDGDGSAGGDSPQADSGGFADAGHDASSDLGGALMAGSDDDEAGCLGCSSIGHGADAWGLVPILLALLACRRPCPTPAPPDELERD